MIYVRQSAYEDMLAHARACTGEMACGILSGRIEGGKRMVIGFYPITNTAHDPERFALDRREHSQAMAAMKKQGASMIATWFCHRDSEARMSAYEIQAAHDRDGSYLVLSLKTPDAPELCSYRVWGGRADKEELLLVP